MRSYYTGLYCTVKVAGIVSEWFEIKEGVLQGGGLFSAKLYHVFINTVVETLVNNGISSYVYVININCVIQADDLALISLFWDNM